jgi:uncharacterized metal-binding protein YceD (DUF177 family)
MKRPGDTEFNRRISIDQLHGYKHPFSIEANAEERKALAQRFGLLSLDRLQAKGLVMLDADRALVRVDGHLSAELTQTCVVSLERVIQRVDAPFQRTYSTHMKDEWEESRDNGREINLTTEDDEVPEPLVGGIVDLGEAVSEHLALEIDPFPRIPDLAHRASDFTRGGNTVASNDTNPFTALEVMKARLTKRE